MKRLDVVLVYNEPALPTTIPIGPPRRASSTRSKPSR